LHEVDAGRFSLEQSVRVEENDLVTPGQHSPIRDSHPKGGVTLSLRELLRLNVSESDGTACDVLLRLLGGPQWVQSYLRGLGVEDVRVETMEKTMGLDDTAQYRNWATPRAMAGLLRAFQNGRGLTAASQALLMEMMVQSPTGPKRLAGMLPAGTVVAHKTGTSGTRDGVTAATNDVGLITLPDGRHLAVVVFVSDSKAGTEVREGVIAKIARAAWESF
jgi:beta-lactamase class A